jgi:uncharacterized protein YbjT (DUF2867 family)
MDVVIAGAHGAIGRRLTRLLAARGDRVRGLVRNPAHADDVRGDGGEPVVCDLEAEEVPAISRALAGADAVVFAAGAGPGSGPERKQTVDRDGAIKLLDAARAAEVGRYVIVSAVGAEDPAGGGEAMAPYLRAKAEADRALRESDRAWTIVRPGRLLDDPGTGRVRLQSDAFRGEVSRDDVAATLVAVLAEPGAAGLTLYVNAGEDLIEEALRPLVVT